MKSKEQILEILVTIGEGTFTAVRSTDKYGANEAFTAYNILHLIADDSMECLFDDEWVLESCVLATPDIVDIEVWTQEFNDATKQCYAQQMKDGELYVASFTHYKFGALDILIWDN